MALSFPLSPSVNDTYTVGSRTWTWSGAIWELSGSIVVAGSITATELASNAVTTAKIAASAVTVSKLASNSVTTAKIAAGAVTATELDTVYAPLASPTFTGAPAADTAAASTNTTQLATTAFVRAEVAALVASAPASLDTLNELALALGSDANFSTTVTNSLSAKAPLANPAFTGVPVAPTAALSTNTTQLATTAFVIANAPEPTLTGPITSVGNATTITDAAVTVNKLATDSVTTVKIASSAVTAAKVATDAITEAKVLDGAITQAKLGSGLSGITVTTTANRDTVIPSPFTGQFAFLTDTAGFTYWDGVAWVSAITTVPTGAPTSVAVSGSPTANTVTLTFTPGPDGGSTITNYQYALSTNAGSTYGDFTALSPADGSSPITISGLVFGTTYSVKLKAVNALGTGSSESATVSFTTASLSVEYLVIAGGGGGGGYVGGGGGAGGLRTNLVGATSGAGASAEASMTIVKTTYTVTVGGSGAGGSTMAGSYGAQGSSSVFSTITSSGGGYGAFYPDTAGGGGGSGGGGGGFEGGTGTGGGGTSLQGRSGGSAVGPRPGGFTSGAGGGGTSAVGEATNNALGRGGNGGAGTISSINGTSYYWAGGGGGGAYLGGVGGNGGAGGGGGGSTNTGSAGGSGGTGGIANGGAGQTNADPGTAGSGGANTGSGGGGVGHNGTGGAGGSGIVIVRYLTAVASEATITGGTATTDGLYTVRTFTGSGSLVIT